MEINQVQKIILGIILLWNSIKDIRSKKISLPITFAGAGVLMVGAFWTEQIMSWWSLLGGIMVGIVLLGISWITRGQLGFGDGIMFCVTGIVMGLAENVFC